MFYREDVLILKIVYKQSSVGNDSLYHSELGISQCNFNYVSCRKDKKFITGKRHHHSGIEIHILIKGSVKYEFEDETVTVKKGEFLLISPDVAHRFLSCTENSERASVHFLLSDDCSAIMGDKKLVLKKTPEEVLEDIKFILGEKQRRSPMYVRLMENRILECIVLLLRHSGGNMSFAKEGRTDDRDPIFLLAEQYIKDNIMNSLTVSELSSYCAVSTKHLSRIFTRETGMNTSDYIRKERCIYLQKLVIETDLSFKEISEMMNFGSEFHFNSFFKKYSGMPPGAYRKVKNCGMIAD